MPNNLTDFAERKVLDHFLGTTASTFVAQYYCGLFTVAAGEGGGGTEVVGGSYARSVIDFAAAATLSNVTTATNSNLLTYSSMPAVTVVAFGIFDAVSAGNLWWYGNLTAPYVVALGDALVIPIGDIIAGGD